VRRLPGSQGHSPVGYRSKLGGRGRAGALLSSARNTLTKAKEAPEERDIRGERPRIGVFVCHCGINIGSVVDVPAVRDYAKRLPYVEYVADNLYSCSRTRRTPWPR
jgi:hypothetical protein